MEPLTVVPKACHASAVDVPFLYFRHVDDDIIKFVHDTPIMATNKS